MLSVICFNLDQSKILSSGNGLNSERIFICFVRDRFHCSFISGKISWRREECLAYTAAVEMVDLPVSENQAKFEDEFGSQEGWYSVDMTTVLSDWKLGIGLVRVPAIDTIV